MSHFSKQPKTERNKTSGTCEYILTYLLLMKCYTSVKCKVSNISIRYPLGKLQY